VTLLALVLMFTLGRCSVQRGVPQAEYDAATARVSELEQRTRDLEEAQVALAAGGIDRTPEPSPEAEDPEPAREPEPAPVPTGGGTTYTVEDGDTLESIAERFYGNRSQFTLIQQANGGVDSTTLQVGQELRIPPAP
jgi:nucleoid-associated protein YgaU